MQCPLLRRGSSAAACLPSAPTAMAIRTAAITLALVHSLLPTALATMAATSAVKPHVFFLLVDDYGWAGAGWHNKVLSGGQREVQTPHMDKLVATGIELNHHCECNRSSCPSPCIDGIPRLDNYTVWG